MYIGNINNLVSFCYPQSQEKAKTHFKSEDIAKCQTHSHLVSTYTITRGKLSRSS